jgi:ribose transport system substrate-binding protein
MRKNAAVLVLVALMLCAAVVVASADAGVYLGTAIRSLQNPYHATWAKGSEAFAAYKGWKDFNVVQTCEGSSEKQLNDIQALVARAKGNVVFSIDPNQSADALAIANELEKDHVYFVTYWNKPEDLHVKDYKYWVSHITFDDNGIGYDTGKALFKAIGGKGKVFGIQGLLGNAAAQGRWDGFQRALKETPSIELVGWQAADWEKAKAYTAVSNALVANPDIKGVWCADDSMAIGALEALRSRNLNGKILVSGVAGTQEVVMAIKKGEAAATAGIDAFWQGGMGLSLAVAAKNGKFDPAKLPDNKREWMAGAVMVTADNVDSYIKNYIQGSPKIDWNDLWGRWVKGTNE